MPEQKGAKTAYALGDFAHCGVCAHAYLLKNMQIIFIRSGRHAKCALLRTKNYHLKYFTAASNILIL